jgi:hypothetical protein
MMNHTANMKPCRDTMATGMFTNSTLYIIQLSGTSHSCYWHKSHHPFQKAVMHILQNSLKREGTSLHKHTRRIFQIVNNMRSCLQTAHCLRNKRVQCNVQRVAGHNHSMTLHHITRWWIKLTYSFLNHLIFRDAMSYDRTKHYFTPSQLHNTVPIYMAHFKMYL